MLVGTQITTDVSAAPTKDVTNVEVCNIRRRIAPTVRPQMTKGVRGSSHSNTLKTGGDK